MCCICAEKVFYLQMKPPNTLILCLLPGHNTQLALKRLLRYWNTRNKVFGDDYILPLTLYGK